MLDELNLIEKSKNGDVEAFSELISAYEKKILNFTYRMVSNIEDAEDITQEVFVKAYRGIGSFDGKSSFNTWIYKIASNASMDFLRKRKSRGIDKQTSLFTETDDGEHEIPISKEGDEPFSQLRKKEAKRLLGEAISELSPEHREVITMRDIDGLSYEEIAKITEQSQGTVKSRISRARLILRKKLLENRELFIE